MQANIVIGVLISLFLVSVAGLIWLLIVVVEESERHFAAKRFRKALRKAVIHSQPTWLQVCDIAEVENVPKRRAYQITMEFVRDVHTGDDEELKPNRALLESYMAEYLQMEPFEGLPSATHLSLERLRKELGPNTEALNPLIVHLKELLKFHDKKNARQRFYTFAGFLSGVFGILLAISVPAEISSALGLITK